MLYFADARWWKWHRDRAEFQAFSGVRVSIEASDGWEELAAAGGAWILHNRRELALCREPNGLSTGQNSGYQAVNLAYLLGAARVVLLGYSMRRLADGKMHWFGDHPIPTGDSILTAMVNNFRRLAKALPPGFEVINATRESALDCLPKRPLESVLSDQEGAALPA